MTDRIRQLTVVLDTDYRDDDVEAIVNALRMVRGVADVVPTVITVPDLMARMAVRADVSRALHDAIDTVFQKDSK